MDRMTEPGCQVVTSWSTTPINRYSWRKTRNLDDPVCPSPGLPTGLPTGPSQVHHADDQASRDTDHQIPLATDKNSNITEEAGHTQDALFLPADDNDNSVQEIEQPNQMPTGRLPPHLSRDLSATGMIMSPNQFTALDEQGNHQALFAPSEQPSLSRTRYKAVEITDSDMGGRLASPNTNRHPFDDSDTYRDSQLVSAASQQKCVNDGGRQSDGKRLLPTECHGQTSIDERRTAVSSSRADHSCNFDGTRQKVGMTSKVAAMTRKKKHQQPKGHVSGEKRRREAHQPLLAHQTSEQVKRSTKEPRENQGPPLTNPTRNDKTTVTWQSPAIMPTLHLCPRRRRHTLLDDWSVWMLRTPLGMANRNFDRCYQKKKVRKKEKSKVTECVLSAEKSLKGSPGASVRSSNEEASAENVINKTTHRLCSILDKSVDDNENTSSDDNTLIAGVNDVHKPYSAQGGSDVNCNDTAADSPADTRALLNRTSLADGGHQALGRVDELLSDSGSDTLEGFDSDPEVKGQDGTIGHTKTTHDGLSGDAGFYQAPLPHLHPPRPWLLRTMQGSSWQRDTLSCPCTPSSEGQIMEPIALSSHRQSAPTTPLAEGHSDATLGGPHASLYSRVFDAVIRCTSSLHLRSDDDSSSDSDSDDSSSDSDSSSSNSTSSKSGTASSTTDPSDSSSSNSSSDSENDSPA